jgi:hypothetical protein
MKINYSENQETYDQGPEQFNFVSSDKGRRSILDKGNLVTIATLGVAIASLFLLLTLWQSFNSLRDLIIFKMVCLASFFYAIGHYLNIAPEVRVDDEHLHIRKFQKLKRIPWAYISYVRAYSLSTVGITYLWIKRKKEAGPLASRFLIIWFIPGVKRETETLSNLLSEIEKRVRLKHTK